MANEKRLIDANELIRFCDNEIDKYENGLNKYERDYAKAILVVKKIARTFPTVDAVEVVRCKDCKHYDNSEGIQWCHLNSKFAQWGTDWHSFPEDGFCSYGERRTDNG